MTKMKTEKHWIVNAFFNYYRKYQKCKISKQMTTDFSYWLNDIRKQGRISEEEAETITL